MTTQVKTDGRPLQTALYDRHIASKARMVEFGGWSMPIQYRGIVAEHQAVRSSVGMFDLSHMGRLHVRGSRADALVQWLTTNDVNRLAAGRAQYSLLCDAQGRILDDVVVYNLGDEILLVVNASNRKKLLAWMAAQQGIQEASDATIVDATANTVMIGVQGPEALHILQPLVEGPLAELRYYAIMAAKIAGVDALVARTGYTGEDGFEVIAASTDGPGLWDVLHQTRHGVTPTACGLGARDTLRLEAGMALYGHEIDEQTNPYEAGLGRVVKLDKGKFVSHEALWEVAERGAERRLVGFELVEQGVPRQDYSIIANGQPVGRVTSGNVSPTLGRPIGMGYVPVALGEVGQEIAVQIRGRDVPARVVALPFYEHRTQRVRRGPPEPGG